MAVPTVIVYESQPRWHPELQRQFQNEEVHVRACRSLSGLFRDLDETTVGAVILDLAAGPAGILQFLGRSPRRGPQLPIVVIGPKRTADLEWAIRELGVLHVCDEFPSGEDLARLCRRQWRDAIPTETGGGLPGSG